MPKSDNDHAVTAADQAIASKIQELLAAAEEIERQDNLDAAADVNDTLSRVQANPRSACSLPASRGGSKEHRAPTHEEALLSGPCVPGFAPPVPRGDTTQKSAARDAKIHELLAAAEELQRRDDRIYLMVDPHGILLPRRQKMPFSTLSHLLNTASHGASEERRTPSHQVPPQRCPSGSDPLPFIVTHELAHLKWKLEQLSLVTKEMKRHEHLQGLAIASSAIGPSDPALWEAHHKRSTCDRRCKDRYR